ncbi:hypothetical protein HK102_002473 [Quaeritorhiza haematococci]|nr:hypothetical protein HK102_002473 [Quaeritorhiza haematococci]
MSQSRFTAHAVNNTQIPFSCLSTKEALGSQQGGGSLHVKGGASVAKKLFVGSTLITESNHVVKNIKVVKPAAGDNVVIQGTVPCTIIAPVSGLASLTITFPASPVDGQIVSVTFTQSVTNLTVSGASFFANSFSGTVTAGTKLKYAYIQEDANGGIPRILTQAYLTRGTPQLLTQGSLTQGSPELPTQGSPELSTRGSSDSRRKDPPTPDASILNSRRKDPPTPDARILNSRRKDPPTPDARIP